jgi:lipopolysaccharide assembly outer membrane protein LptD (OstA)
VKVVGRRGLASLAVCGVIVLATRVFAAGMMGMESGDLRIQTDSTDYNIGTGDFTMPHHVSATRPGTQIDGDHAFGNGKQKIVHLEGHVAVHSDGQDAGSSPLGSHSNNHDPSTLTTDKLTIQLGLKRYAANGHVHFVQGSRNAVADRATLDDATHDLHMMGNVHLEDNGQSLDSDTLDYNTETEEVHANTNVQIIVPIATAPPGAAPSPSAQHGRHHHS